MTCLRVAQALRGEGRRLVYWCFLDLTGGLFEDTKIGRHCRGLFSCFPWSGNTLCRVEDHRGVGRRLPPRTLPYTVGVIILISGALLAIRSWRFHGEDPVIKWPDRRGTIRVLITLVSLGVYLALMDPLGLPLSTFLYVSFTVWYLGKYRLWYTLLIGVLSGGISYLVFILSA